MEILIFYVTSYELIEYKCFIILKIIPQIKILSFLH